MQKVFLLLADGDGTFHSSDQSLGLAVTTKEEAERFVHDETRKVGYSRSYQEIYIFDNKDTALDNFIR